jgi:transcriptional regulator with XRE-family HTH domain
MTSQGGIGDEMATLGGRIKQRRHELGWTQDVLAQKAAISKSFLSDLENGKRSVGADTLLEIARALNLSLDYLVKGTEPETMPKEINIPTSLSQFATEAGLSFSQTLMLLDMQRQIIAHRSATKKDQTLEDVDWRKFYQSVRDFL